MREIKFRAWDKNADRMLHFDTTNIMMTLEGIAYLPDDIEPNGFRNIHKQVELMQYTGLKDKNGKEIYEGDILQFSDKWEWYRSDLFKFWLQGKTSEEKQQWIEEQPYEVREVRIPDCYEGFSKSDLESAWEVIGNIYKNPELIKAVEEKE